MYIGKPTMINGINNTTVIIYNQIKILVLMVFVGFPLADAAGKIKIGKNKNTYSNNTHTDIIINIVDNI